MDPVNQSAQISSSQGFADGQNSATKESKLSDSFLSSSPVTLIQSPQEKRVVPGSDKSCEGIATSLRFSSQAASFSPDNYGGDAGQPREQPNSPIKTSPVSERIKALEALAAKKESDFRSDGGFFQSRDRYHEKSSTETHKPSTKTPKLPAEKNITVVQTKGDCAEQVSPESPFEVLGDFRQVNEFEETEEWMKAHLPPVPNSDAVDLIKRTVSPENVASTEEKQNDMAIHDAPAVFAGAPDIFMGSTPVPTKLEDDLKNEPPKQSSVEESGFDLNFLPTAYMWEQLEQPDVPHPSGLDSELPDSPAPPEGFGSPSPTDNLAFNTDIKQTVMDDRNNKWTGDLELPEVSEVDSSEESDDTVIEDAITDSIPDPTPAPDVSNDPIATASSTPDPPSETKVTQSTRSERKLMQVPTINVIETDEPNYSDEEMEPEAAEEKDYETVKEGSALKKSESERQKTDPPRIHSLESELIEGFSPSSSPVDSDNEYSPKHKMLESQDGTDSQESLPKPEDSVSDIIQVQSEELQTTASCFPDTDKEDYFPDNDEWSGESQDILEQQKTDVITQVSGHFPCSTEPASLSQSRFMSDHIYGGLSFTCDYDATQRDDRVKECLVFESSQVHGESLNVNVAPDDNDQLLTEYPPNPYSILQSETISSIKEPDPYSIMATDIADDTENRNSLSPHKIISNIELDSQPSNIAPNLKRTLEGINPDSHTSEPTDSFLDFMRECLKSREGLEPEDDDFPSKDFDKIILKSSQPSPTMVMDLEQEQLTINALKELGSSQEQEIEMVDKADQDVTAVTCVSRFPYSQSRPESTYSKEVEAIDIWMAEAYHLAEHVLTTILTHLSVKDLIHWRDPKKSGLVFGVSMLLLLSLAAFSVISVASYLLLALLCVTISFRIYKSVVQAVQKSSDGHPFKALIDKDVSIPPETFRKHVDASLTYINQGLKQISRLFLVEDLVDSLKLAVAMWLLTYVGAVFNGITILILADILLFAIPPIYEKNKTQIDQYINLARTQINTTITKLQEKLPGAMKRTKTE